MGGITLKIKWFLKKCRRLINRLRYGKCETVEELRGRGVKIGNDVSINTDKIDYGHGYLITIGNNVTISDAALLTHDGSTKGYLGYSKVGRIDIGDNVFVGYGAIVLPNVKIGNNVIIGAGTIVNRDIPDNSVVVGNPAKIICSVDDYVARNKRLMESAPVYNTVWSEKSQEEKDRMYQELANGQIGFDI